ncbi:hypothetical protein HPP92_027717 [Vanilla planifolia]|uniref:Uncharacterized protein n=1 Tax=Vanilla planifolia TaxID=51239 RepID=A0A835PA59_VANPL|nr:hypothetical protein HPP92_027717 [Vanilla planifolia]
MNTIYGDNGGASDTASSIGDCDGVGVVLNLSEDVAKLLFILQGRMNGMRNYIKRLKSCISRYIDLEDCYLAIQDELNCLLESEKSKNSEIESQMNSKIEEFTSLIEEYQTMKDMKQQVQGVLNLIDLVKRASAKSGSTGDDIKDNPE